QLPEDWDKEIPRFLPDEKGIATRVAGGRVLNALSRRIPNLIGGSADLNPSTKALLEQGGDFQFPEPPERQIQGTTGGGFGYGGLNIPFGVREHAMGGIINGMAYHGGLIPFGSTFLVFSDYLRPSFRLAALSGLHVIYVFTHDSVAVGEDGPTHQPVEHLAALRAIPGLLVLRPADANETAEAWKVAVNEKNRPVAIILSRQSLPVLDREKLADASGLNRGAYILAEPSSEPDIIFIATGSEVHIALKIKDMLSHWGINARVVSMPSWELFDEQHEEYRKKVLPEDIPKVSIEAGRTFGWHRYVCPGGIAIGIDHFGASAPGDELLVEFGFTAEEIALKTR
ncbi:MAG: transketolase, partial [Nitrospirae bacterium]